MEDYLKFSASSHRGLRDCHCTLVNWDCSPTLTRTKGWVTLSDPCSPSACNDAPWLFCPLPRSYQSKISSHAVLQA